MGAITPGALQKLMADLGGEAAVMKELVDTYLDEGPRTVTGIRESLARGDRRGLNRGAHSMKSTAATFGAAYLSQLCRDLEKASEAEIPADAAARVSAIEAEWALVKGELAAWKP